MSTDIHRARWPFYTAVLWSLLFAAPHTWWALGSTLGFPGGPEGHQFMLSSAWRYVYLIVVTLLSFLGAAVALVLVRGSSAPAIRRSFRVLAWTASMLLVVRGVAGMIADGRSDPVWWPMFLIGGLLFGVVARESRATARAPAA